MNQDHKLILIFAVIFFVLGILFIFESQRVGKLRLIFCDVGQGDGMLIVTPKGKQIVVDGGPGTKIVHCLGKKMPFWDRTIELMVVTHPQQDHMEGQIEVFRRYKVEKVGWTGVEGNIAVFAEWEKLLEAERSEVFTAKSENDIDVESLLFDILWPTQSKLSEWENLPPQDLNDSSVVFRLNYGEFCAYFTGDIPKEILESLITGECEVLKISHHGSKTGTNEEIINKIKPEIAVIQVGKNRYGHPTKEVLDLLAGIEVLRNDKNGTVEIATDGQSWTAK